MPPGSPAVTRVSARKVILAWPLAGALAGLAIGGGCGIFAGLVLAGAFGASFGLLFGVVIGPMAGLAVGLLVGLLLAWLHPAPGHVPLAAAATTELILLPAQIWLWLAIDWYAVIFPLLIVVLPSVVSVSVAAALGRRLPPGAGSRPA